MITGPEGRYELCRIPLGTGLLSVNNCDSFAPKYVDVPVEIRGDTVLDVDLTFGTPGYAVNAAQVPR
jgi:hypothetical protein